MITLGKRETTCSPSSSCICTRNRSSSDVREEGESTVVETALQKLFNDLASRYSERQGGYTCIL